MTRTCRDCGTEFSVRHIKGGYIDQCDQCAEDPPNLIRHVGTRSGEGKHAGIEIFRGEHALVVLPWIRRQNAAGFGPNLSIGSPAAQQKFEDKIQEKNE